MHRRCCLADESVAPQVWGTPQGIIPGDEVRILLNWELPIGDTINPTPRSSGPRLLAHPDSPRVIRRWSPGFATLATNHILDAGAEGLANIIGSLNQAGFTTVGAGRTWEEITRPLFWETAEGAPRRGQLGFPGDASRLDVCARTQLLAGTGRGEPHNTGA
jgi:hypothetical protein